MTEQCSTDGRRISNGSELHDHVRRLIRPVSAAALLVVLALGCRGDRTTGPEATEATDLRMGPASVSLVPGDTVQLEATPVNDQGKPVPGYEVSWSSGDTTVATVDGDGTVTARSMGSTTVTAAASNSNQGSSSISASVQANQGKGADNGKGKKKGLKKESDVTVTDSTSSTGEGLITNVEPTAYEKDTLEAGDSVYVDRSYSIDGVPSEYRGWRYVRTANDDKSVTSDSAVTFTLNDTARVALAYDSRATTLPDWLQDWTATGDTLHTTDVAFLIYTRSYLPGDVALGGNLSGGAEGASSMYVLSATPSDSATDSGGGGSDTTSATGALQVTTSTTGDSLDSDGYDVVVDGGSGQSIGINDTLTVADLAAEDHSVELTDVASNCSVSGDNPRSITVAEDDTVATSFEVSCEAVTVASVTVSPDSAGVEVGSSTTFSATVRDSAGNELDRTVSWSSSNTSVATVNSSGTATGESEGSALIIAASNSTADSASVTVHAATSSDSLADVVIPSAHDWTDRGEVIPAGSSSAWDKYIFGAMNQVSVLKKGETLYLYYVGADGLRDGDDGPANRRLGVATSTDGLNWTKEASNPVVDDSGWEDSEEGVFSGGVWTASGTIYAMLGIMEGSSGAVDGSGDLYTSSDGVSWGLDTRDVLDPDGNGFGNDERFPFAAYEHDGTKYVFYAAKGSDVNGFDLIVASGPSWDNLDTYTELDSRDNGGAPVDHPVNAGGGIIKKSSSRYLLPTHDRTVGEPNRTVIYSFDPSDPHNYDGWTKEFDALDSDVFGEELQDDKMPGGGDKEEGFLIYLDRDLEKWFAFYDVDGGQGNGIRALTAPMELKN